MNMRWKSWIATGMLAFAVGLAMTVVLLWPPPPGVTYANFSRIEKGMTREQVRALLGEPFEPQKTWDQFTNQNDDIVMIEYDEEGQVSMLSWNLAADYRTATEKLRDRVPLLAHDPPRILVAR
jgi:SmpA / OmlA family